MKLRTRILRTQLGCRSPHGERGLKFQAVIGRGRSIVSLSSWRAWIEIAHRFDATCGQRVSLSSWRAWIEIPARACIRACTVCRSPHGERGLKFFIRQYKKAPTCRSPHGERGLKYLLGHVQLPALRRSLSSWRAWIEMTNHRNAAPTTRRSPHGERGLK